MKSDLFRRSHSRKDDVRLRLPFDDIMEFAIALLSISPHGLEALGWSFVDRKRFLDHFFVLGRAAQGVEPERLGKMPIEIVVPKADLSRLQQFAVRELPRAAYRLDLSAASVAVSTQ
ncbi:MULTISPECIES: hypothetical protein [Sphingobium]|uniref:hypothetical protein n=1 Tax=Sphingobium TaxID=165695 RepID=UPI00159BF827